MGTAKILFLGGFLGGIFLILMGYVSFSFLHLGDSVTGGLLTNMSSLFSLLDSYVPFGGTLLTGVIGGLLLVVFPIDWCLWYRPDDIALLFGLILPWAITGVLIAAIFAHNAKEGFICGLAQIVWPMIFGTLAYFGLGAINNFVDIPIDIGAMVNGLLVGLVDRNLLLAILTATLEGGALAGVFGALIGALKFKPGEAPKAKKVKKSKEKSAESSASPAAPGKAAPAKGKKDEDFFVDFE